MFWKGASASRQSVKKWVSLQGFGFHSQKHRGKMGPVTPVPKFLFSEQKLKMLPQGGAYAMFSTRRQQPPVAARPLENRVVIR
jgi:hypothetical protein